MFRMRKHLKLRWAAIPPLMIVFIFYIYSYFFEESNQEIQIIFPEYGNFKIRPKYSGGIEIPNSLIYQRLSENHTDNQVNILILPETPINIRNDISIDKILENLEYYDVQIKEEVIHDKDYAKPNILFSLDDKNTDKNIYNTKLNLSIDKNSYFFKKNRYQSGGRMIQVGFASSRQHAENIREELTQRYEILKESKIYIRKMHNHLLYEVIAIICNKSLEDINSLCMKLINQGQNCIIKD